MKTMFFTLLILFAPYASSWNLPASYSAGPTWGKVIDADTQRPIKGALVIALWELEGGLERSRSANLKVAEALTNELGEFRMDGWGPLPRSDKGLLDAYDPLIIIFKSGYTPASLLNDKLAAPYARVELQLHDSAYNGQVTALKKYEGTPKSYALIVGSVVGNLSNVFVGAGCRWQEIPKTVRVLDDEAKRERERGITSMIGTSAEILLMQKQCEPTDQFLRAYRGVE